ncbi:class I SAM-dependent methyltransferase [Kibdelosporangium aridum]|uniref:class I SAM-dependent methyltransferase n=1 Tax=Kibdelosporangium aridum TaxID=2030 RepID=UPI00163CCF15|nr:class I SAM-dependent methyltransferase [Kibdelosporangium aridum]
MAQDFAEVADVYRTFSTKGLAAGYRDEVESFTALGVIGPVDGQSVLDLACGFGKYGLALAQRGATRVFGVDISPEMISQATAAAGDDPRITFAQYDVAEMPKLGTFDLAVAIYLLQYAKTVDELTTMCRNIAANLRPGGRLVALTVDSRFRHGEKNTEKYGFSVRPVTDPRDEDPLSFTMFSDPPVTVGCTYFERDTYDRVARLCGFRPLRWHSLLADPALEGGGEHYRALVDNCPFVLFSTELAPSS